MNKKIVQISIEELTNLIENIPVGYEVNFAANNDMSEYWGAKRYSDFENTFVNIGYYGGPDIQTYNDSCDEIEVLTNHLLYSLEIGEEDEHMAYMYESDFLKAQYIINKEKKETSIHAQLDKSISSAIYRTCDLIPRFLTVIKDTPDYAEYMKHIPEEALEDESHPFWETEAAPELMEKLFETLDSYALESYNFGTHIGDGADFGNWKMEE